MAESLNLPTRISLLELAQSGKEHPAWEELLDYYRPFVRRVLMHMRVEPSEVDDVCQLALLRLWKNLAEFQYDPKRARFRTWLSQLIYHTAIDWHRQRQRDEATSPRVAGTRRLVHYDWYETFCLSPKSTVFWVCRPKPTDRSRSRSRENL